ncbi:hypothetical protein R1flu_013947 [Riccia fluitans]|uniref:Uncharacterized protein n=1 Tax=Riccia fluitans TaxID=41844 RepID=A0ABD1YEQ0_9MARC
MRIKKDSHLVKPLDPDVDTKSQKTPKKKQTGSKQPSRKRPKSESDPKDGNEGNLPSAVESSQKGKEKVIKSSHRPDVDISSKERRTLKIGMTANRLEMDPSLSTPIGQTSGRGNNHIPAGDTTKEVPPTSSKIPSDGIMEESVSQMTTMLSNILEHHGRANERLASLEEDLAHAKLEEKKLKATIEALEQEKSEMNAKVALMERKDLYDLLEAKIFVRGHRTFQDEVDRTSIDVCYQSLLKALKAATGTLPNSLAIFEYMQSIFDSYVNPTNNPNVQPLVKGLDADDFSMDKFFGLQDPTTPDDAQASPDFEEDLKTNERVRLRAEVRNLGAEPQWLTRSTRICLEYEPIILPDVAPTENPARLITLDLTVDAREDPSSLPQSQIVLVPTFVDLTQYISFPENKGSEDRRWSHKEDLTKANLESTIFRRTHDPKAIFHVFKTVLCLNMPIDPALIMTAIMNVEQQQDGHSCGKHVLQMLVGAAKKESDGLDRCFREEGLIRYIATLDKVRSFDVVFGMYLSRKMAGPPM